MNSTSRLQVGVYGDVDLNQIDGSAIWLASLAEVVSTIPGVDVHVPLKIPLSRSLVTSSIESRSNITMWPPGGSRLNPRSTADRLMEIDGQASLDVLIVRGRAVATAVAESGAFQGRLWLYLTDIPQQLDQLTPSELGSLDAMFGAAARVLCQTENLRSYLTRCLPQHDAKYILLPPMVPPSAFGSHPRHPGDRPFRLFYAGKFAPGWGVEHMVESFRVLRQRHPDLEFHIAGDKIHDPRDDPSFRPRIVQALESDGVVWHGALTREGVLAMLDQVDLALAVRDPFMDASRELSTKLLEFCAAGVPVLCNRNGLHEELFGAESPLMIAGYGDLTSAIEEFVRNPARAQALGASVSAIASEHSFDSVAQRLRPALEQAHGMRAGRALADRRIVVAGHDLKFARSLIAGLRTAGAEVREDVWGGHERHDEQATTAALAWADTAIAEWCLANAVHYSHAARPDTRLIVRFHRTELNSPWPEKLQVDRTDAIVFVGEHIREEAIGRYGWSRDDTVVVPNFVDEVAFDRPKLDGARHTLGLLGYLPALKRLDRALDLLERLRRHDPRYRLAVRGAYPWDLDWVWRDSHQRAYFGEQLERIRSSPLLRTAVSLQPPGPDTGSWFRSIGVILSPSDIESFHLALVEGMLSRAMPVVWDRPGAEGIVSDEWIVADTAEASEHVLSIDDQRWVIDGARAREEAIERYAMVATWHQWLELLTAGSQDDQVSPTHDISDVDSEMIDRLVNEPRGTAAYLSPGKLAWAYGYHGQPSDATPVSNREAVVRRLARARRLAGDAPLDDADDIADLFVAGFELNSLPEAATWRQLATEDLGRLVRGGFSPSGLHRSGRIETHVRSRAVLLRLAEFSSDNRMRIDADWIELLRSIAATERLIGLAPSSPEFVESVEALTGAGVGPASPMGNPRADPSVMWVDEVAGAAVMFARPHEPWCWIGPGRDDGLDMILRTGEIQWIGCVGVTSDSMPVRGQVEIVDAYRTVTSDGIIARVAGAGGVHRRELIAHSGGMELCLTDVAWADGPVIQVMHVGPGIEVAADGSRDARLMAGDSMVKIHQHYPAVREIGPTTEDGVIVSWTAPHRGRYRFETSFRVG